VARSARQAAAGASHEQADGTLHNDDVPSTDDPASLSEPSWARPVNVGVKVLLAVMLAVGLVFPGWAQFQGKGWPYRCLLYPIPAVLVPAIWQLKRQTFEYPHRADALLTAPFLLDIAGNVLNFYNTVDHFDDVLHFCNWVLVTSAFGVFVNRTGISRLNVAGLCVGFGATAIILWEAMEYTLQKAGSFGLALTYDDTISDLVLSFSGGVVAAWLCVTILWPVTVRRSVRRSVRR
jgi:hypothetical protein